MLIDSLTKLHPPLMMSEGVAKLSCGKAAGIYNISAELLKAEGEVMIIGLHAVWHSGFIPSDWIKGLVVPI